MTYSIPQFLPWFDLSESESITNYMKSGNFLTEFHETQKFENELAEFLNAKHVITVNNGTLSIWAILQVLDLPYGSEVIVPNYTMIATANAVRVLGLIPKFCDVEIETLCLDLNRVKDSINSKTKAVILVNANGRTPSYHIQELVDLCAENNLALIEDSAQGLGSYYPDKTHVGLKGIAGSFSLSVPKIITTGQGGFIATNNDEIEFLLRRFKDFGRSSGGNDIHDYFGVNLKFTDMQAAIGRVQLTKITKRITLKRELWKAYWERLGQLKGISFFNHNLDVTTPWFVDCLVEDRNEFRDFLSSKGIGTRFMYSPITSQRIYKQVVDSPNAEIVGLRGIWLPSHPQLSEEEFEYICENILRYFEGKG